MLQRVVGFSYDKYLKSSRVVRTVVTEVNNTESRAIVFTLHFH